jgi:hypothetical protein
VGLGHPAATSGHLAVRLWSFFFSSFFHFL